MRFELGLERPEPRRALVSAATIALSYVAGGLVPLLPYVFVPRAGRAMAVSVAVTLAALLFFGFVKGRFTGDRPFLSAVQTTVVDRRARLRRRLRHGQGRAVHMITHHYRQTRASLATTHLCMRSKENKCSNVHVAIYGHCWSAGMQTAPSSVTQ